jgi:hypothetical protein
MDEGTSVNDLLSDIKPEMLFALFARRFQYYGGDEKEEPAGPAELLVAILDDVRACLSRSESSPGSSAVGGGVCGLSAAYLLRAQELKLLSKALVRACFDNDEDEDEEDDGDEPASKKPKVLIATPAYSPTVYLHQPKKTS